MRWTEKLSNNIKKGLKNWLLSDQISDFIQIREMIDFQTNAIRNRVWYRGDSSELEQLYEQFNRYADRYKFWAAKSSRGMEMRKIHLGIPSLMVKVLSSVVLKDLNEFEFAKGNQAQADIWKEIEESNHFRTNLERVIKEVLYLGDGAYKITINTEESPFPILEWYPGDRIEVVRKYGKVKEIIFKTPYTVKSQTYTLCEHYGYGYITNELYKGDSLVDIDSIDETKGLKDYGFDKSIMLAVHMMVYESSKWEGRGGSIFDSKIDSFDALDEVWSQWMDALRAGRAKTYIPENLIPRNPDTGELLKPNAFDNRYIKSDADLSENATNKIDTEQPSIPHDSYLASYVTALDLCLQGIISPSTLGIDVKKLDNAEAQREKEKVTLYTRNAIVEALQETLPDVVSAAINAYNILMRNPVEDIKVNIHFGEYANPSFESQVETIGKARTQGIMSIERSVEELYGDTLDEKCKQEEIRLLKIEQGVEVVDEPKAVDTVTLSDIEDPNQELQGDNTVEGAEV